MRRNILNFNFLQQLIFPVYRKKSPVDFGSQRERKHHLWVSDDVYGLTSTISSCVPPTTTWSTTYGRIYKARLTTCLIDLHVESVPYSSFSSSNEYCTSVKTKLYTSIIHTWSYKFVIFCRFNFQ